MITIVLKSIFRLASKRLLSTLINLFGLTLGFTVSLLSIIYALQEFSYDKHLDSDTYRILTQTEQEIKSGSPYRMAPELFEQIPDIKSYCRLSVINNANINHEKNKINIEEFICADVSLFEIFDLYITEGNSENFHGNAVFISKEVKDKFQLNPYESKLTIYLDGTKYDLEVAGVYRKSVKNSIVKPDIIAHVDFIKDHLNNSGRRTMIPLDESWSDEHYQTLLKTSNVDEVVFLSKISRVYNSLVDDRIKEANTLQLQALDKIYLNSDQISGNPFESGNKTTLLLFVFVSLSVLIISLLNFIVLSTAKAFERIKSFTIHRINGADRKNLRLHILTEVICISVLSIFMACIIIEIIHSDMNSFLESNIDLYKNNALTVFLFSIVAICFSWISALLIFRSIYKESSITRFFKDRFSKAKYTNWKVLIFAQLAVFISLLFFMLIFIRQVGFIQNFDKGYKTDNILCIEIKEKSFRDRFQAFKKDLLTHASIEHVTGSNTLMPRKGKHVTTIYNPEKNDTEAIEIVYIADDFIETFDLKLNEGNALLDRQGSLPGILINKSAKEMLGESGFVGNELKYERIAGIVQNFNLHPLHEKTGAVMFYKTEKPRYIYIKHQVNQKDEAIEVFNNNWNKHFKDLSYEIHLAGDMEKMLYKTENKSNFLIKSFSFICMLLSAMGLFGLSYFIVQKKQKDYGIRKIVGAKSSQVFMAAIKDYFMIWFVAAIVASFAGYYLSDKWLSEYAFRIGYGISDFILPAMLSFFVVFLSIGIIVLRVSRKNPVWAIKYE